MYTRRVKDSPPDLHLECDNYRHNKVYIFCKAAVRSRPVIKHRMLMNKILDFGEMNLQNSSVILMLKME